jgi:hypothetical protein
MMSFEGIWRGTAEQLSALIQTLKMTWYEPRNWNENEGVCKHDYGRCLGVFFVQRLKKQARVGIEVGKVSYSKTSN